MHRIFMSFRKVDDRATRERTYARLSAEYGADQVFKSGESIPPGTDYVRILQAQARACPVMLVLIGDGWLPAQDPGGVRLIDREHDWVRFEIRTALESGNRVVPVLLGDDILLPTAQELPDDIAALARLQAHRISHSAVDTGLDELVVVLSTTLPRLASGGGPSSAPPAPSPSQHNEVREHGVGIVAGTVHGPVIGGNAQGPVVGRDAHGPVVGGDLNQTTVKKNSGGATAAGLLAAWSTLRKPFAKAAGLVGDHRLVASISVVVVLAGAGVGAAIASNSRSHGAGIREVGVVAATTAAAPSSAGAPPTIATGSLSPSPTSTLASGVSLDSIPTDSNTGNAWADGSVLAVQELAALGSIDSATAAPSNQYELQTYSLTTGRQLGAFAPDGLNQGTLCIDDLVHTAQDTDLLLVEQTNVVPAQGLTASTESVELEGLDASDGNQLWTATLPVAGTTSNPNFCTPQGPGKGLTFTTDGKYALDTETGTDYLVNLATGETTAEPDNTAVLGRWLVESSTAIDDEDYPADATFVDPTTGSTINKITDNGNGDTADFESGDEGGIVGTGGQGSGYDVGGNLDVVTGSRPTERYGDTVEYSLPSATVMWDISDDTINTQDIGSIVADPDEPDVMVSYESPGATYGAKVSGFAIKTGKLLWSLSGPEFCGATRGHVYALANNQLVELDEATGKQISYDASVSSCPLVFDGVIDEVTDASPGTNPGANYTNDFIIG